MKKITISFICLICGILALGQEQVRPKFSMDFGGTRGFITRATWAKTIPENKSLTANYSLYILAFGTDHKVDYENYSYDPYFTAGGMLAIGPQWYVGKKFYWGIDIALGVGYSNARLMGTSSYFSNSYASISSPYYQSFPSLMNYNAIYCGFNLNGFRLRLGWGAMIISGQKSIGIRYPISISAGFNVFGFKKLKEIIDDNLQRKL